MDYPQALLQQARELVATGAGRPRQVDLRRAVSSAYYAIFHRTVQEATTQSIGPLPAGKPIRARVSRWFKHGTMSETSAWFARTRRPRDPVARLLGHQKGGASIVPPDLHDVAAAFVALQEARHTADYDLSKTWTRAGAKALVERTEEAFRALDRLQRDPVYGLYLLMMLVGDGVVTDR